MNITALLAKMDGFPDKDKQYVMDLNTKIQNASKKEPQEELDLRKKTPANNQTLSYYLKEKKQNTEKIKEKTESIKRGKNSLSKSKKSLREARLIVLDAKRREAIKNAKTEITRTKRTIKLNKDQIEVLHKQGVKIRATIKNIKHEGAQAKIDMQKAIVSIKNQNETIKLLNQIKSILPKIDLNDPKYAQLIAFYSANANKKPSLDNPLDTVPTDIKVLLSNLVIQQLHEKMEGKIILGINTLNKYKQNFTSSIDQLKETIKKHIENHPDFIKQYDITTITVINPYFAQEILRFMLEIQQQKLLESAEQPLAIEGTHQPLLPGKEEPKQLGTTVAVAALPPAKSHDKDEPCL